MSTPPTKKAKLSKVFEPDLHKKTHREICDARGPPLELGKGCEVIDLAIQHYADESYRVIVLLRAQNTGAGYARAVPLSKILPQLFQSKKDFFDQVQKKLMDENIHLLTATTKDVIATLLEEEAPSVIEPLKSVIFDTLLHFMEAMEPDTLPTPPAPKRLRTGPKVGILGIDESSDSDSSSDATAPGPAAVTPTKEYKGWATMDNKSRVRLLVKDMKVEDIFDPKTEASIRRSRGLLEAHLVGHDWYKGMRDGSMSTDKGVPKFVDWLNNFTSKCRVPKATGRLAVFFRITDRIVNDCHVDKKEAKGLFKTLRQILNSKIGNNPKYPVEF